MGSDNSKSTHIIQSTFKELSKAATFLNNSTDELSGAISALDGALKRLNIGLYAWVPFFEWGETPMYGANQVGYCKVGNKWGIAIRVISGDSRTEEEIQDAIWSFAEAPREYRLEAIEKIPELLIELTRRAAELGQRMKAKAVEAESLAAALEPDPSSPFIPTSALQRSGLLEGLSGGGVRLTDLLNRGEK